MSQTTKIEWTERTWNPMSGCAKVSDGCANCYAETMAKRLQAMGTKGYENGFAVTLHPDRLGEPLKTKKPSMFFVCSMGDLFHEDVSETFILSVFEIMRQCPHHTFQILTKRADRMEKVVGWIKRKFEDVGQKFPLPNVWIGVTAENQEQADKRIPILLDTPAALRFVSVEPMLGNINLEMLITKNIGNRFRTVVSSLSGVETLWDTKNLIGENEHTKLDWVICGGETSVKARAVDAAWVRSIKDQCEAAGVAFFFKQWGEFIEESQITNPDVQMHGQTYTRTRNGEIDIDVNFSRCGKKRAGHLLDGEVFRQMPHLDY